MILSLISILILAFSLSGLFIGFLLAIRPDLAIEIQRRFYARINWKVEPISMPKEVRNTRIMGVVLIALLIMTLAYILTR